MERDLYFIDRNLLDQEKEICQIINDKSNGNAKIGSGSSSFCSIISILKECSFGYKPKRTEYKKYLKEILSLISEYNNQSGKISIAPEEKFKHEKERITRFLDYLNKNSCFQLIEDVIFSNNIKEVKNTIIKLTRIEDYNLISEFHADYSNYTSQQREDKINELFNYIKEKNLKKNSIYTITLILAIWGDKNAHGVLYHKGNSAWNVYSDLSIFELFHFSLEINKLISKYKEESIKNIMLVTKDEKLFNYYKYLYSQVINKKDNKIPVNKLSLEIEFLFDGSQSQLVNASSQHLNEIESFLLNS